MKNIEKIVKEVIKEEILKEEILKGEDILIKEMKVNKFLKMFNKRYSNIDYNLSNKEVEKWLNSSFIKKIKSDDEKVDLFANYLLAQGLAKWGKI